MSSDLLADDETDLLTAAMTVKGDIFGQMRQFCDQLGVEWSDELLADAWLDFVRDVSEGVNRLLVVLADQRIVYHKEQFDRFARLKADWRPDAALFDNDR